MVFFQGCLFIIRIVFSWKCRCFIRWRCWFGWYFACFWIRIVIRQKYNCLLWHTDTFLCPNCIIITQCVFQYFLSLVYHPHHFWSVFMNIFVRVKLKRHGTIGFCSYLPLLKTHSNKEQINSLFHPLHKESIPELFEWISHSVTCWRLSYWDLHLLLHFFVLYLPSFMRFV